jgi:hypothetical protein
MTTKEPSDPGKPCSFPFIYKLTNNQYTSTEKKNTGFSFSNCSIVDNNGQAWCFTKVHADRTKVQVYETSEVWGNCREQCKGDLFEPSNENNLAEDDFENIWDSDIYDLRHYNDGFCHTYNPKGKQSTSFDFRMGLFIGMSQKMHCIDKDSKTMLCLFMKKINFGQE